MNKPFLKCVHVREKFKIFLGGKANFDIFRAHFFDRINLKQIEIGSDRGNNFCRGRRIAPAPDRAGVYTMLYIVFFFVKYLSFYHEKAINAL